MQSIQLTPATDPQYLEFILLSQEETGRISYCRDLTPVERDALKERLFQALTRTGSHVKMFCSEHATVGYYWLEERADAVGFLLDFYIAGPYRKQGYGSTLINLVVKHSESLGLRQIKLAVADRNQQAKSLFARTGFLLSDEQIREGRRWVEMSLNLVNR